MAKAMIKNILNAFILLIIILFSHGCSKSITTGYDFPAIVESDTLSVLTFNTSTSYFIYRDQPMGYHYDMISQFCRQHSLVPNITVAENWGAIMRMLKDGVGDVIVYNMPVTNQLRDSIVYCGLQQISHQVLVQRVQHTDSMITDVTELIGKKITVVEGSKHHDRIINLNNELG